MKHYTLTVERRAEVLNLMGSEHGIDCQHPVYLDPSCYWCDVGYVQDCETVLAGARHPEADTDYQDCLERVAAHLGWEEDE